MCLLEDKVALRKGTEAERNPRVSKQQRAENLDNPAVFKDWNSFSCDFRNNTHTCLVWLVVFLSSPVIPSPFLCSLLLNSHSPPSTCLCSSHEPFPVESKHPFFMVLILNSSPTSEIQQPRPAKSPQQTLLSANISRSEALFFLHHWGSSSPHA